MVAKIERVHRELDEAGDATKAKIPPQQPTVVPCHVWDMVGIDPVRLPSIPPDLPRLVDTGLSSEELDEQTKLVRIACTDSALMGVTNKGHVLLYDHLGEERGCELGEWDYVRACLVSRFPHAHMYTPCPISAN